MYTDDEIIGLMRGGKEDRNKAMKHFFTDLDLENEVVQKILTKGGQQADAKDAFQEGFKVFYRHLSQGNFQQRSNLKTYFIGICIRCWLDGLKKNFYKYTKLTADEPSLDAAYLHTPEVELMTKERKVQLQEVLKLLGERCKNVILLGFQGFSGNEIMKMLDLKDEGSVRKIRYRCMDRLRKKMQDHPNLWALLKTLSYG